MVRECGCLGGNEHCTYCYGLGYVGVPDRADDRRWANGSDWNLRSESIADKRLYLGHIRRDDMRPRTTVNPTSHQASRACGNIRVNELARELQVKPNAVLDLLPELGVVEKKIHSSVLKDDIAWLVRLHMSAETQEERGWKTRPESQRQLAAPAKPSNARPVVSKAGGINDCWMVGEKSGFRKVSARARLIYPLRPPLARFASSSAATDTIPTNLDSGTKQRGGLRITSTETSEAAHFDDRHGFADYYETRRLDGARDFWSIRDHGQFGSHPTFDACDDESNP